MTGKTRKNKTYIVTGGPNRTTRVPASKSGP